MGVAFHPLADEDQAMILAGIQVFVRLTNAGLKRSLATGEPLTLTPTVTEMHALLDAAEAFVEGLSGPLHAPQAEDRASRPTLRLVAQASA